MSLEAAATVSTPIVERVVACLWDNSIQHASYLTKFKDSFKSLEDKMDELQGREEDVKRRIELDEATQQMERRPEVAEWLRRVEAFKQEVGVILQDCSREIQQRCCGDYCPKNWWSRYRLSKKVCKKLKVVVEVINQGQFELVSHKALPSRFEAKYESPSVGMDEAFAKVWSWLADDAVKTIGIFGTGGVGKTTLLKKINNKFQEESATTSFHGVIWVVVSSQFNLQKVQKQIGERLGLAGSEDDDQNRKAQLIFNALSKKKFLLLLDDVWKPLNFEEIGIPSQKHSKVVLTTRSESVCGEMEVDKKFKVPFLDWDAAWTLFQQKLGQEALNYHPEIPKLAELVAKECGGLPLALITIGRAMSIKKTPHEWNHALKTLQKYAAGFSGMDQKVLSILKFSYDNLEDDIVRDCFLYFSLYPEDSDIPCRQIVDYWMGEGFLDEFKDMDDVVNKGYDIIGSLKAACLLEMGISGETHVKMHDIVRDLALWIGREYGEKESKILVEAKVGLIQAPNVESWEDAERISLMENEIEELTGAPKCPHLRTLMLRSNRHLSVIPDDFFQYMPILRVLDLSRTSIKVVPKSIGDLLQLQFLVLYNTKIRTCPEELGNLVKLKFLNLMKTWVETIPSGVISRFPRMQVLRLGDIKLDDSLAAELESLGQLRELGICITNIQPLLSQRLISCITNLVIRECTGLTELAKIIWRETPTHLLDVKISGCSPLKDISWLVLAPLLIFLMVDDCSELEEIILDKFAATIDGSQNIFSRLKFLELKRLPKLKSIVRGTLVFPDLRSILVTNCSMLKKLPLGSTSTDKSKLVIYGSAEWWNELQWEDEIAKSSFQPFFVE
ncbi:hypothetical protein ACHQM5_029180 [Ranunculus cassubicifolius]